MKNSDTKYLKNTAMKLENLLWTLKELNPNVLSDALNIINENIKNESEHYLIKNVYFKENKLEKKNPNKNFLIGVLPNLLQNKDLFPLNEDIYEFAFDALHIKISRYEKRSRYELIGLLVCATNELDESELSYLVTALEKIVDDNDEINKVISSKKSSSFSWNEAIQNWYKKS